jgi:hypothetical protein
MKEAIWAVLAATWIVGLVHQFRFVVDDSCLCSDFARDGHLDVR